MVKGRLSGGQSDPIVNGEEHSLGSVELQLEPCHPTHPNLHQKLPIPQQRSTDVRDGTAGVEAVCGRVQPWGHSEPFGESVQCPASGVFGPSAPVQP